VICGVRMSYAGLDGGAVWAVAEAEDAVAEYLAWLAVTVRARLRWGGTVADGLASACSGSGLDRKS